MAKKEKSDSADVSAANGRPKTTEEILGRLHPGAKPLRGVVNELLAALDSERSSKRHQDALAAVNAAWESGQTMVRIPTYETPAMLRVGSGEPCLVYGKNLGLKFHIDKWPGAKVPTLHDECFGLKDHKVDFPGGLVAVGSVVNSETRKPIGMHGSMLLYLGRCTMSEEDLWHFAVKFRAGYRAFDWPGHYAFLMCPFCAKFPTIDNSNPSTFYMISQMLFQFNESGASTLKLGTCSMERLVCSECFPKVVVTDSTDPFAKRSQLESLQAYGAIGNYQQGKFGPIKNGIDMMSFLASMPPLNPGAHDLATLFHDHGLHGAFSEYVTRMWSKASGKTNSRSDERSARQRRTGDSPFQL